MIISVNPLGQMANRMLAYMFARSLAWTLGGEVSFNVHLTEWGLRFDQTLHDELVGSHRNTL